MPEINAVTGAFSYNGKYIAQELLRQGKEVVTLTNHPNRDNSFGTAVRAYPYNLNNPDALINTLQGVSTIYNTYWIRFPYQGMTFDQAVENTKTLIHAAESAGVKRFVHLSVTNPSLDSSFLYFRGKALVEQAIINSKLSYAILRPALIFEIEDILINNIAWCLRRFPIFPIPGDGNYHIQPIYATDLAELAVNVGQQRDNLILDTIGPETYTYTELVRLIKQKIQSRAMILPLPPNLVWFFSKLIGTMVNDILITRDEIMGLMANLLMTNAIPNGKTKLSDWLDQNALSLGKTYASELGRHYR
jgi:uncharacterized protein YbjT (DUF2867 family)